MAHLEDGSPQVAHLEGDTFRCDAASTLSKKTKHF